MFQHTATRRWLQIRINTCICHSRFQHTATRRWLLRRKYSTAFRFLGFNTQPPEGGCFPSFIRNSKNRQFQHTATRRWLPFNQILQRKTTQFQHTATRRWLHFDFFSSGVILKVSTHSHPKVAASYLPKFRKFLLCFNTQPPEGGCVCPAFARIRLNLFQHTATRRWLQSAFSLSNKAIRVSTHSHPKVAANISQQKVVELTVSTHSHPKVAACKRLRHDWRYLGFNTQPPEGGCFTAGASAKIAFAVSTHSHPKVAASKAVLFSRCSFSFNTQPPEGGCKIGFINLTQAYSFNTQPPEGGCHQYFFCLYIIYSFNTQPPEGGCLPISKFTC